MAENWITRNYKKGTRITVPSKSDPNATTGAVVLNHYTGLSKHVEGITVQDDDGNVYRIEASFLDEGGGGV